MTGLLQADAVALPVADDTVDLVVTSPPYFALRSYQDDGDHYDGQIGSEATPQEFLDALWTVTRECVRVLKPSGSLWVNLGDKYAGSGGHNNAGVGGTGRGPTTYTKASGRARPKSLMGLPWRYAIGCIDDLGLILRAEVVWSKPNGLPESAADRVRRSHEQWFHFTLEPRYFSALDEIREPPNSERPQRTRALELARELTPQQIAAARAVGVADVGRGAAVQNGVNAAETQRLAAEAKEVLGGYFREFLGEGSTLGRLPDSVWSIPLEPLQVPDDLGVDHFAAFPQEWPRRLILGWCPPDGVVLDPFAGTGTVPMVARALGRTGIGVDLSADYLRLAAWRVFESGHASKTVARTNGERQGLLL